MKIKVFFLFTYFSSLVFSQTHFTIPQNVWRVSYNKNISAGKWIGYDGEL